MDEVTFWSVLVGTFVGAATAFLLAYYRERFDEKHSRIVALIEAQSRLSSQYAFYVYCRQEILDQAQKAAGNAENWALRIPFIGSVFPERVRLDKLDFLLDQRFHRDCYGYSNVYLEILGADRLCATNVMAARRFNELKGKLGDMSIVKELPPGSGSGASSFHAVADGPGAGVATIELKSIAKQLDEEIVSDSETTLAAFRCIGSLIKAKWPGYRGIQMELDHSQLLQPKCNTEEDRVGPTIQTPPNKSMQSEN